MGLVSALENITSTIEWDAQRERERDRSKLRYVLSVRAVLKPELQDQALFWQVSQMNKKGWGRPLGGREEWKLMIVWQFGFKVESQNSWVCTWTFGFGIWYHFVDVVHVLMVVGVLWLGGVGGCHFSVCVVCVLTVENMSLLQTHPVIRWPQCVHHRHHLPALHHHPHLLLLHPLPQLPPQWHSRRLGLTVWGHLVICWNR